MNIVIQTVFFMALAFGQLAALLPNISKALLAAAKIFSLMDRTSKMDVREGRDIGPTIAGNVRMKNVQFAYPTRPSNLVLKGISLEALPGTTVSCSNVVSISILLF